MYRVLDSLKLTVHPDKRYIRTTKEALIVQRFRAGHGWPAKSDTQVFDL